MKFKNTLFLLPLFLWMCSSEKEDNSTSSFDFMLNSTVNSVVIDQQFKITVVATEPIKDIEMSTDNFATFSSTGTNGDNDLSKDLYFNFDTLGSKTISIRVRSNNDTIITKSISITIVRGQAIKIIGLQLISFHNINQTWDPEFNSIDSNRLADLQFVLSKVKLNNFYTESYGYDLWHRSSQILNQGNMTWNLTDVNLYLNPLYTLKFGLADVDNGGLVQDLMQGPPYDKSLSFTDYLVSKPSILTYFFPEINLEFKLFVEWP